MLGGESKAGGTSIHSLLLDFMRVILAQHQLFYPHPLSEDSSSVKLNLQHSEKLFRALELESQTAATQWVMILKLYRLGCLKEINFYNNSQPNMDAEAFFNYRFDYNLIDPEIELVLVPDTFQSVLKDLEQIKPTHGTNYTIRLYLRDNRVMLAINDRSFQVSRVNEGSIMQELLLRLERMPSGDTLTITQFKPLIKGFRFDRTIDKNGYRWLKPLLPVCDQKVISLRNPAKLPAQELVSMLPEIAENYRQDIASYLGLD